MSSFEKAQYRKRDIMYNKYFELYSVKISKQL
jgi:hypothetical protein